MYTLIKICILSLVFSLSLNATTFIPLPFDKQLEVSDFLIEASLVESNSFKTSFGHVSTRYFFEVFKIYSDKEFTLNQIELVLPGGSFDGVTTKVDGSPSFKKNQSVFLLIKIIEGRYYLSNFTLGKYEKLEIEGEYYFVNEIFPNMKNIGKVKEADFFQMIKEKWKIESKINKDETVNTFTPIEVKKPEDKVARKIASTKENNNFENYVVYFFSIAGVLLCLYFLRRKNENK